MNKIKKYIQLYLYGLAGRPLGSKASGTPQISCQ